MKVLVKLCVPNVIKRVNMQVYNFLMMLNETRNVLWHESCKCICKLNSSVCSNRAVTTGGAGGATAPPKKFLEKFFKTYLLIILFCSLVCFQTMFY